jgi:putative aldouronate transport system substrate-binding protein
LRYGVENETYTVNDGKYLYTDLIANNPDGLNSSEAVTAYIRNGENIPLLGGITTGARAVMETVYEFPEHKQQWKYGRI